MNWGLHREIVYTSDNLFSCAIIPLEVVSRARGFLVTHRTDYSSSKYNAKLISPISDIFFFPLLLGWCWAGKKFTYLVSYSRPVWGTAGKDDVLRKEKD